MNIIGVIMIYIFGVADIFNKRGNLEWIDKPEDNEKIKKANTYSSIGFICVVIGFFLQIIFNSSS